MYSFEKKLNQNLKITTGEFFLKIITSLEKNYSYRKYVGHLSGSVG